MRETNYDHRNFFRIFNLTKEQRVLLVFFGKIKRHQNDYSLGHFCVEIITQTLWEKFQKIVETLVFLTYIFEAYQSSTGEFKAYGSHAFQRDDKKEIGDLYYINFDTEFPKSAFPKPRLDQMIYRVEITAIYGMTVFFAIRIDDR